MRIPRPSVPTPLVLLLFAVLVVGTAWALLLPPWQSPDEQWHFAYAQTLAEHGRLPDGDNSASFSTEQLLAAASSRSDRMPFQPEVRAPWDEGQYDAWQRENARLPANAREDGGGVNNASSNPPLFYAVEAVPYKLAGGDVLDRLYAMRLVSVLFLLVAVVATWLLAGELFGRNRTLQLAAAAVVGFQPMATFMAGSVNPDSPLLAFWSLALWLGVRILRRGLTTKSALALAAVVGGAVLTKATGYLLVIAAAILIGWKLWRQRSWGARGLVAVAAGCVLVAVLPFAVAELTGRTALNQVGNTTGNNLSLFDFPADYLGSYLWQFYLPRAGFLSPLQCGDRSRVRVRRHFPGWLGAVRLEGRAAVERRLHDSARDEHRDGGSRCGRADHAPGEDRPAGPRVPVARLAGARGRAALDRVPFPRGARWRRSSRGATCCRSFPSVRARSAPRLRCCRRGSGGQAWASRSRGCWRSRWSAWAP